MLWKFRRTSANVQDRRRVSPRGAGIGGFGLLVIIVIVWLLGGDPGAVLNVVQQQQPQVAAPNGAQQPPANDEMAQFVSVVLADTEEVWDQLFREMGRQYRDPQLIL